jgi:hypothetical protein
MTPIASLRDRKVLENCLASTHGKSIAPHHPCQGQKTNKTKERMKNRHHCGKKLSTSFPKWLLLVLWLREKHSLILLTGFQE